MAHNNWEQLELLLGALDYPNNDIYLHIDKKAVCPSDAEIANWVKKSKIYIYHKYAVAWGGDTQIKCELFLLGKASKSEYAYYHLVSGIDIPLKTQEEIHSYFRTSSDKNFVSFNAKSNATLEHLERVRYYRIFQNKLGRLSENPPINKKILCKLESISLSLQGFLNIDRTRNKNYRFYKGSSWFSITHTFAIYVVSHRKKIMKQFGYSLGADELLMQTLIMNSKFATTVENNNLRFIDWSSSDQPGAPKTLTIDDYDAIVNSDKLFARKFDLNKDSTIIYKLYHNLK